MLLGGDESGHTQRGNNTAYCQDNEISWRDWRQTDEELTSPAASSRCDGTIPYCGGAISLAALSAALPNSAVRYFLPYWSRPLTALGASLRMSHVHQRPLRCGHIRCPERG